MPPMDGVGVTGLSPVDPSRSDGQEPTVAISILLNEPSDEASREEKSRALLHRLGFQPGDLEAYNEHYGTDLFRSLTNHWEPLERNPNARSPRELQVVLRRDFHQQVTQFLAARRRAEAAVTQPPADNTVEVDDRAATLSDRVAGRTGQVDARQAALGEMSPLSAELRRVQTATSGISDVYDYGVTVELPNKPPDEMEYADYRRAYLRAMFTASGVPDVTDTEIARFEGALGRATEGVNTEPSNGAAGQDEMLAAYREQHRAGGGTVLWATTERSRALVDAGAEQIMAWRRERGERDVVLHREAQRYGEDAAKGWVSIHVDSASNVINGATEPLRGLGIMPNSMQVPRLGWQDESEYWQQHGRGALAETVGTLYLGGRTLGALPQTRGTAIAMGGESAYHGAVAASGVDPTTGRELTPEERVLRGAGALVGSVGAARSRGADELVDDAERLARGRQMPPGATTEAVTPEGVRLPVPQPPHVDPNSRMVASVDSSGNASGIRFRDDYMTHIAQRDFSVPRRSGIGGAHNLNEFNRYLNEINVVSRTPHPTVPGVYRVEYQLPALDGRLRPLGRWQNEVHTKTVYDPAIISDRQMMEWGRQAFAEAQSAGNVGTREWDGVALNGIKFHGYLDDTGAVRSFFPDF